MLIRKLEQLPVECSLHEKGVTVLNLLICVGWTDVKVCRDSAEDWA